MDRERIALSKVKRVYIQLEEIKQYSLAELASEGWVGFCQGE